MAGATRHSSVLFAVALPFFLLYFRSMENWWAIILALAIILVGIYLFYTALRPRAVGSD